MKIIANIILVFSAVWISEPVVSYAATEGSQAPANQESGSTEMVLERELSRPGPYNVGRFSSHSGNKIYKKYTVWHPLDGGTGNESYPVIIIANGTGSGATRYKDVYRRLASWGFIVAGNGDENSRSGASSAATLDFVIRSNADKNCPLHGKVDTTNIGIIGYSQGGIGAFHAVTDQPNGHKYKAIYAASPTSPYWAQENELGAEWRYEMGKIDIPCFMVAGTGYFDAGKATNKTEKEGQGICPLWGLLYNFKMMPDTTDKIIARHIGIDHGDILQAGIGYMTAWFLYHLKGEQRAGKAFWGEDAELRRNPSWQDVRIHHAPSASEN